MSTINITEKQSLTVRSLTIVKKILDENPEINEIISSSVSYEVALTKLREKLFSYLEANPAANNYYNNESSDSVKNLSWKDVGIIRLLNYIDYEGSSFLDPNRKNIPKISRPIKNLYNAVKFGKGDFVQFPKGLKCRWQVTKSIKKHYQFS